MNFLMDFMFQVFCNLPGIYTSDKHFLQNIYHLVEITTCKINNELFTFIKLVNNTCTRLVCYMSKSSVWLMDFVHVWNSDFLSRMVSPGHIIAVKFTQLSLILQYSQFGLKFRILLDWYSKYCSDLERSERCMFRVVSTISRWSTNLERSVLYLFSDIRLALQADLGPGGVCGLFV